MSHSISDNLNIFSLNVKGLNHPIKRRKIMDYLAKTKGDIILVQETKLSSKDSELLNHNWILQVSCSPAEQKNKGVITLIAKKSNITLESYLHDETGRLLVTHLRRGDDTIHVINI